MLSEREIGPPWTILKILRWTTDHFKRNSIENPRADTEILLAHVLKCKRIDLYLHFDQPLTEEELSAFRQLIKRRLTFEPVAYIIGSKEFWSLTLAVSPEVLIPRPDTECVVEAALKTCRQMGEKNEIHVLELGTGSGAISLALAKECPACQIVATDISVEAVKIARANARFHQLDHRIEFIVGSWLDFFNMTFPSFNIVISNPPYVPLEQLRQLSLDIREFEPSLALNGGTNGLDCLSQIIHTAYPIIIPGGALIMEIGFDQKDAIESIGKDCKAYNPIEFGMDYSQFNRVVQLSKR
jgi:release factor glutamine methyltransferase